MTRRPDLFIIGAAKCGTTSLYEYLKGHPEVFMSPAKEPRYCAPDLASAGTGHDLRYRLDEDRYLALFAEARGEKRLGEASVRYIYSLQAARLIHEFQPRPYIIAMLRNPVDVVQSMHNQRWSEGAEEIADFEQALAAEEERKAGVGIAPGSNPMLAVYRDRARFGEQLPRWFETFERDRIHVIIFEDMIRDPAVTFRRVLQFLEVDPEYQPQSFAVHNPRHQPRNMALRSLTNWWLPQLLVWRVLPRVVGDRATRGLGRRFTHSRLNRKPAARTTMRPETRRRLEQEFAPDVARLSELLDRDLAKLWFDTRGGAVRGAHAGNGGLMTDSAVRRPDLFIIGAAKCGTTSMYQNLSGHPEVFMSPRKEPRYFAPDLMTGVPGKNLRYGERVVGEANAHRIMKPFRRMNRRTAQKPKLNPELRRRLEDELAPDVERLSQLLDRDLAALWFRRSTDTAQPKGEPLLSR